MREGSLKRCWGSEGLNGICRKVAASSCIKRGKNSTRCLSRSYKVIKSKKVITNAMFSHKSLYRQKVLLFCQAKWEKNSWCQLTDGHQLALFTADLEDKWSSLFQWMKPPPKSRKLDKKSSCVKN